MNVTHLVSKWVLQVRQEALLALNKMNLVFFTSPQGRNLVPFHRTRGRELCSDLAIFFPWPSKKKVFQGGWRTGRESCVTNSCWVSLQSLPLNFSISRKFYQDIFKKSFMAWPILTQRDVAKREKEKSSDESKRKHFLPPTASSSTHFWCCSAQPGQGCSPHCNPKSAILRRTTELSSLFLPSQFHFITKIKGERAQKSDQGVWVLT